MSAPVSNAPAPSWTDVANVELQQRLVEVAEIMVRLTYAQIILGLVGAIGLLITIWYTRRALQNSRDAFEHARKIDKQDRRAWLVATPTLRGDLEISPGRFRASLDVHVKNIGNIPAVEVRCAGILFVSDGGEEHPKRLDNFWSTTLGDQMADGKRGSLILPDDTPLRSSLFVSGDPREFAASPLFQSIGAAPIGLCLCLTYTSGSEKGRYVTAVGYWLVHKDQDSSLFSNQPSRVAAEDLALVPFEGGFAS